MFNVARLGIFDDEGVILRNDHVDEKGLPHLALDAVDPVDVASRRLVVVPDNSQTPRVPREQLPLQTRVVL